MLYNLDKIAVNHRGNDIRMNNSDKVSWRRLWQLHRRQHTAMTNQMGAGIFIVNNGTRQKKQGYRYTDVANQSCKWSEKFEWLQNRYVYLCFFHITDKSGGQRNRTTYNGKPLYIFFDDVHNQSLTSTNRKPHRDGWNIIDALLPASASVHRSCYCLCTRDT